VAGAAAVSEEEEGADLAEGLAVEVGERAIPLVEEEDLAVQVVLVGAANPAAVDLEVAEEALEVEVVALVAGRVIALL
jgi:hypothetical protein